MEWDGLKPKTRKLIGMKGLILLRSVNAYGNFIMYENLNKNDLNSFDSYRGLGILNGLSVGNLGFLYGTSAEQGKNGYYETNLSRSFGVSLNVNPVRFDLSKGGGRTWIPFF